MANDAQLDILIKLQDEASQKLAALGGTVKNASESAKASLGQVGSALESVGSRMTVGVTAPIVAGFTLAIKSSLDFNDKMLLLETQAGATANEIGMLKQGVLDLAGKVAQSPNDLADALFHIESSGIHGAKALDTLKLAAQGATVGHADLEQVTNALVAAQVTGIKGTESLTQEMGTLNAIVGAGNMRMNDLAASMSTGILPSAKVFGLSLNDVGAALDVMTRNGVPAEEAATRLRMTFSLLAAPTGRAADELLNIGISSLQLANDMRSGGIVKAVQDLEDHLTKSGLTASEQAQVITKAFGGGRTSSAILTLVNNVSGLKDAFAQVSGGTASAFQDAFDKSINDPATKVKQTMADVQVAIIKLGNTIAPILVPILDKLNITIQKVTEWWGHLSTGQQKAILIFLGLAAVLGPIIAVLGAIAAAIAFLLTPIGEVVAAIALFIANIEIWGSVIAMHWNRVKQLFAEGKNWIANHSRLIGDALMNGILGPFGLVAGGIERNWQTIRSAFANGINHVIDIINASTKLVSKIPGINIPQISHVSFLMGGTMREDGFAYLHKGEKVITAQNNRFDQGVTINFYGNISTQNGQSDIETLAKRIGQQVQRAGVGI